MSSSKDYGRENVFDFLRLFAAVAVMIHHAVVHLDTNFLWHTPDDSFWFNGGVSLFFVLSGMMVYRSAERCFRDLKPWREFYRNRALRVVPALYAYLVALIIILVSIRELQWSALSGLDVGLFIASNLILAPVYSPADLDDFGVGVINGSLWTIPVEVSFYIILPVLVILATKIGWARMMAGAILISAIGVVLYSIVGGPESEALVWKVYGVVFLPYLWYFLVGIFWAKMWSRSPHSGWLAIVCVFAYFFIVKWSAVPDGVIASAVAAIPLSYAAMWFGHYGPRSLHRFTKRVGDLSFSGYIWHMIVVNLLVSLNARTWAIDGTLLIIMVVGATLGIAAASWWFVEKPALARKRYSSKRSDDDSQRSAMGAT